MTSSDLSDSRYSSCDAEIDDMSTSRHRWHSAELKVSLELSELNHVTSKHSSAESDEDFATDSRPLIPGSKGSVETDDFSDGAEEKKLCYTVEEAIEHIGFGRFQMKVMLAVGLFQATDALEMLLLSVLSPELRCEFQLEEWQVALITTIVFVGMFLGSSAWGTFADTYGRRITLLAAAFWISYFGSLTSQSPNYYWILILRGLVGCGFGGAVQSFTLLCEYLPSKYRAKLLILSNLMWTGGCLFEIFLAYVLIPRFGWRVLVIASALPSFVTFFCIWSLPESVRFLLAADRRQDAMRVLTKIARTNRTTLPDGHLVPSVTTHRGRYQDMFTKSYCRTTLQLLLMWFGVACVYYGIILVQSELLEKGGICGDGQRKGEESCRCQHHIWSDYLSMIVATIGELAIIPVNLLTIDRIGRKASIGFNFIMAGIFYILIQFCTTTVVLTLFIFGVRAFISGCFNVIYIYTGEVFPTTIRSIGLGSCSGMARIGCMVTPFIAQVLLSYSVRFGLGLYGVMCFVCAISAFLLPIETKGRPMQQLHTSAENRHCAFETPR